MFDNVFRGIKGKVDGFFVPVNLPNESANGGTLTIDLFDGYRFTFIAPTRAMMIPMVLHMKELAGTHPALPVETRALVAKLALCHTSPFLIAPIQWFADMAQDTPDRFEVLNLRFNGFFASEIAALVDNVWGDMAQHKGKEQGV